MDTVPGNQSEVARLRQQIEAEYQAAAQAMTGFSQVAKHEFITARIERIGVHQEHLAALVGEQASMQIVCEIFEDAGTVIPVTRG
jgi:hypothetical protein